MTARYAFLSFLMLAASASLAQPTPNHLPYRGASPPEAPAQGTQPVDGYRLSGFSALRPSSISDDGVHTYIGWPQNTPLPAIYTVDAAGRESLSNGAMRSDLYVVDSIENHFIFRLDGKAARADRTQRKQKSR